MTTPIQPSNSIMLVPGQTIVVHLRRSRANQFHMICNKKFTIYAATFGHLCDTKLNALKPFHRFLTLPHSTPGQYGQHAYLLVQ